MCLIEDQSWIDCIDITSRWDTFVLFHLYGNKRVSLPLWPIRPRWFHTFSPCAEPLGDGHEGMGARFGSQGSIALNWHSRYSGTRYSGTWLYLEIWRMTLKNNRAPLLRYFKLCASFRSHWWIQTGVTIRKRLIWVKINDFFLAVWPCNLMYDLEQGKSEGSDSCDRPSNLTQIGFKSWIFQPVWPCNLMDDPEKQ